MKYLFRLRFTESWRLKSLYDGVRLTQVLCSKVGQVVVNLVVHGLRPHVKQVERKGKDKKNERKKASQLELSEHIVSKHSWLVSIEEDEQRTGST